MSPAASSRGMTSRKEPFETGGEQRTVLRSALVFSVGAFGMFKGPARYKNKWPRTGGPLGMDRPRMDRAVSLAQK